MPRLQQNVDSLDGIDQSLHQFYIENPSGGFMLDLDGGSPPPPQNPPPANPPANRPPLPPIQQMSSEDQAELARLRKEDEERKAKKLKDAGDFDALQQQMQDKHNKELQKVKDDNAALQTQINDGMIQSAAHAAFGNHGANAALMMPHVERQLGIHEGQVVAIDPVTKQPRLTAEQGSTNLMTADELVGSMKSDPKFSVMFAGTRASGGGSNPAPPASQGTVAKRSDLKSSAEKVAYIQTHGEEAYQALPH